MNSTHNDFNHIEFIVISYKLYPAKKRKRLNKREIILTFLRGIGTLQILCNGDAHYITNGGVLATEVFEIVEFLIDGQRYAGLHILHRLNVGL